MPNPFDRPAEQALRLPKLEHLPVYLPETELIRSARGQQLVDFSRDPESPRAHQVKLTATERVIFSVRERSSHQLANGCFVPDVKPPPLSPTGRAVTRSQLLEQRKEEWKAENARTSWPVELTTIYPRGSVPGAPGRRQGYSRFSHLETSKVRK